METHTRETVTTGGPGTGQITRTPGRRESTWVQTVQYVIYYIFGALELLLAFRLVLKLFGANPNSGFVSWIYNFSAGFIWPFLGIFPNPTTEGAVTTAVFEPATLVAIIVYVLLAWGVAKLVSIFGGERQE